MRVYGRPPASRWMLVLLGIVVGVLFVALGYGASQLIAGEAKSSAGPPSTANQRGPSTPRSASGEPKSTKGPPVPTPRQPPPAQSEPPGQPVPILMYHVIAEPPPNAPYPDLYVPPDLFRAQIRYLHDDNFHAVTLHQVWEYWHNRQRLPKHPIVLSFDDGYLSQYTVAAKVLARYHWPGVLNLAVNHLHMGTYGLGVGRVEKMIAQGWEIDSHTIDHIDVTTLDTTGLQKEIAGSRAILRRLFHQPVDFFCYPAGRYNTAAINAIRQAGYLAATTTNEGLATPNENPYTLNRVRVHGNASPRALRAALTS